MLCNLQMISDATSWIVKTIFPPPAPGRNPNDLILHNIGVNAKASHLTVFTSRLQFTEQLKAYWGLLWISMTTHTHHTHTHTVFKHKACHRGVDVEIFTVFQHSPVSVSPYRQLYIIQPCSKQHMFVNLQWGVDSYLWSFLNPYRDKIARN